MDKKYIERPQKFDKAKYNAEYAKNHYKRFNANISPEDFAMIDDYCKAAEISKARLLVLACKEYIDNHKVRR